MINAPVTAERAPLRRPHVAMDSIVKFLFELQPPYVRDLLEQDIQAWCAAGKTEISKL